MCPRGGGASQCGFVTCAPIRPPREPDKNSSVTGGAVQTAGPMIRPRIGVRWVDPIGVGPVSPVVLQHTRFPATAKQPAQTVCLSVSRPCSLCFTSIKVAERRWTVACGSNPCTRSNTQGDRGVGHLAVAALLLFLLPEGISN